MKDGSRMGAKVRALRRRQSLSQAKLAEMLGISASYLNLIEHDRRPLSAPLLIKLAQAFQLDLTAFAPELILVSAGFDAHKDDPLAGLNFEDEDYAWVTERLVGAAAELCDGRLISTLEGGYNHEALGRSCVAHVRALMAA